MTYRRWKIVIFGGIVVTILITAKFSLLFEGERRNDLKPPYIRPLLVGKDIVTEVNDKPRLHPVHAPPVFNANKTEKVKNMLVTHQNVTQKSKVRHLLTYEQYGQLGNVMFQYAGLLGVAKMNDRIPFIQPKSQLVRAFKISHVMNVPHLEKWKLIGEPNYATYDPTFEHLPDEKVVLQAYLQSYRYFQSMLEEVKREFQFLDHIIEKADKMMALLKPQISRSVTVGVHVRRGDKLTRKEQTKGEVTAPKSYFSKAFQKMRDKYGNVTFLVASDDYGWCERNILGDKDVVMLPVASREVHLCFLSQCSHMIMSVGTFGWWAGLLGGGEVIYYDHPVAQQTWKYGRFEAKDFFLPHWIGIEAAPDESIGPFRRLPRASQA